jgi:hypothetical protein
LLLAIALLLITVPLACWLLKYLSDERSVAAAIAETERLDPHWRFEDILARRAEIPDEENSSLQVLKAMAASGKLYDKLRQHLPPDGDINALRPAHPPQTLGKNLLVRLRALVANCAEGIAEARELRDMPKGRPPIVYAPDFISTLLGPVQDARDVCALLHCDVLARLEDGDVDGAMHSCHAMLNAGRSVGDEPFIICFLVRAACVHLSVDSLERVLAQGESSEPALAELQAALERELAEPTLLTALRGERACGYEVLQLVCDGKLRPSRVSAMRGKTITPLDRLQDHVTTGVSADRAAFLRWMNKLVEAARLPIEQQADEFDRLRKERPRGDDALLLDKKWIDTGLDVHLRLQANLRCAVAALASERYRLKHGAWPGSLEAVVKSRLLGSVPLDVFDGQPLRLKRTADGLVIYSVGADRTDNHGTIDRGHEPRAGTDLGFRLWDVSARRQELP